MVGYPSKLVLLLSVTAFPALIFAQTLESIEGKIRESRLNFPSYLATISEEVTVSGTPRKLEAGDLSWGDRNGRRTYQIAHLNGKFLYDSKSYYGEELNGLPPLHKTFILDNGTLISDEPTLQIGEIQKVRQIDELPPSFSFMQTGHSVDEIIGELKDPQISATPDKLVEIKGDYQGMAVEIIVDPSNDWSLTQISYGHSKEVQSTVKSWIGFAGRKVPETIETKMPIDGGSRIAVRRYEVINIEPLPKKFEFKLNWRDGTRVYDRINDKVLTVKDGELEPDPVFDKSSRTKVSSNSAIFIGAGAVGVLSLMLLAANMVRRRNTANR